MSISRRMFVLFGLAVLLPGSLLADDAASRAVVEKAIEAHGGEKVLAKFKAATSKIIGTVYLQGVPVPIAGEIATQEAVQQKAAVSLEIDGQMLSIVSVLNGDQGWLKVNNDIIAMSAEQLAETKESAYSAWVATLLPLKDKAFTLAPFGEIEIAGRKSIGVNVTREGHRPINLFFDQETSRLVRSESRVRDETSGQEVTEEATFSNYKLVDGAQQPTKLAIKRNDKPHADIEVQELRLSEKLDDSVFTQP